MENVTKTFDGQTVLDKLNMTLQDGGCYAVEAPSGWGKTTLLRLLCGLEKPDGGKISGLPERACVVFQENRLLEGLTAEANVALVLPKDHAPILPELALVGLEEAGEKPVGAFSGGMKRRVAIVRAMMAAGKVLLLDEPFKGLDEETKKKTIAYVRSHRDGRTLLLVTHDRREADELGCTVLNLTKMTKK